MNRESHNNATHYNVICDVCKAQNFNYYRYKCTVCKDYDQCGDCFEQRKTSLNHDLTHPMLPMAFPSKD